MRRVWVVESINLLRQMMLFDNQGSLRSTPITITKPAA
jgi:hypothetical protein